MESYSITDNYVLIAFDLEAFQKAESEVAPDIVRCIRVGAKLYNSLPSEQLIPRLRKFHNLHTIVLSDDWIKDEEMPIIRANFEAEFPQLTFSWKAEGLVAGKHGR